MIKPEHIALIERITPFKYRKITDCFVSEKTGYLLSAFVFEELIAATEAEKELKIALLKQQIESAQGVVRQADKCIADLRTQIKELKRENASLKDARLDKPAKVNAGIFNVGVPIKSVIEATQRQYQYYAQGKELEQ